MARGGKRAGAGRKPQPKEAKSGVVLGMDGLRRVGMALPAAPAEVLVDAEGVLEPPADMAESDREAWRALAPHAVRERTLTASKTPGFRRLCRQWVACAEYDARIAVLGLTSAEADRLVKRWEKAEQRLDASLGNFGLRAFGKPVTAEKKKTATANPFAAVSGR